MPSADPYIRGETAKRLIRGAQKTAGVKLTWPITTDVLFSLAKLCGYSLNRAGLSYIMRKSYVAFPEKAGGSLLWTLDNVVALFDCLEGMRKWLPLHPSHRGKYLPHELAAAEAAAKERVETLRELAGWSVPELVNALLATSDETLRESITMVLQSASGAIDCKGDGTEAPAADVSEN